MPLPVMRRRSNSARAMLYTARGLLVLITLFWGVFALLSGVGGDDGLPWWQNLTNAAPWVLLASIVWMTFFRPLIGGGLIIVLALASVVFFNAWIMPVVLFGISLPLLIAGLLLLLGGSIAAR